MDTSLGFPGRAFLLLLAAVPHAATAGSTPSFTPLGDLPGGAFLSTAVAISHDGSVVLGSGRTEPTRACFGAGLEPFVWTAEDGMVSLSALVGADLCGCVDMSADGSVLACFFTSPEFVQTSFVVSTTLGQGGGVVTEVPEPAAGSLASISAMSDDGLVIAGTMVVASGHLRAFRWPIGSGSGGFEDLGDLPGGANLSQSYGIAGNGLVVVGASASAQSDPKSTAGEAFRWSIEKGMVGLGDFPGNGFISEAFAATPDGAVIVGRGRSESGVEALRWTEATGLQPLGDLPGGAFLSIATSVSDDGRFIVGQGQGEGDGSVPFIWDACRGMRSVQALLTREHGIDLTGWSLTSAMISGDGLALAGSGTNPRGETEAWVAHLGPTGDIDRDGDVDGGDLGLLLAGWGGADATLDLDCDGVVAGGDLGLLLADWGA